MPAPTQVERRRHPRRPSSTALVIETFGGGPAIPCESVDVSIGGMRIRSSAPIPRGGCDIVVFADTDHPLVLLGEVLEIIEGSLGTTTARVIFLPVLSDSADAGHGPNADDVAVLHEAVATRPVHRRGIVLLAAGISAGLVALVGDQRSTTASDDLPETAPASVLVLQPVSAPRVSASTPAPELTAPATTTAPAPVTAAPPRAAVSRTERADNLVQVTLGTTADDTAISSFVGPSDGVERVRVQLNVTPEPDGTSLPLEVTLENRGEEALVFPDGFDTTIAATRDGVVVATATFTATGITEVAPGQLVRVGGLFDFGATGDYDLTVEVPVAE